MVSLKYRIVEDGAGWLWEVFTHDRRKNASGIEASDTMARVAAMQEGIRRNILVDG
jgi:hypothetical protein